MNQLPQPVVIALVATLLAFIVYKLLAPKRITLSKREAKHFPLIEKFDVIKPEVGMHTMLFRFALPNKSASLDLEVGQHVTIGCKDAEGKDVSRSYTPITDGETKGHIDLIIKVYPTGIMGNYLKNLPIGQTVPFRGPVGRLIYNGNGNFAISRRNEKSIVVTENFHVDEVAMLAGGTGITPMLQIIRAVANNPNDKTKLTLVYGNQTVGDIMCRSELDECAEKNQENIKVWYMVDRAPVSGGDTAGEEWKYGVGFITSEVIQAQFPKPSNKVLVLQCGPPRMIEVMSENLAKLGYSKDRVFNY